jgi:hypothetical protein
MAPQPSGVDSRQAHRQVERLHRPRAVAARSACPREERQYELAIQQGFRFGTMLFDHHQSRAFRGLMLG